MYESGKGVPQDDKQAVRWYRKSAEQGDAGAQNSLGFMYGNGDGVLQNYKKSYMWFNLAKYNGFDTKEGLTLITPLMTSSTINEAQTMSKTCLESNYTKCN